MLSREFHVALQFQTSTLGRKAMCKILSHSHSLRSTTLLLDTVVYAIPETHKLNKALVLPQEKRRRFTDSKCAAIGCGDATKKEALLRLSVRKSSENREVGINLNVCLVTTVST